MGASRVGASASKKTEQHHTGRWDEAWKMRYEIDPARRLSKHGRPPSPAPRHHWGKVRVRYLSVAHGHVG